MSQPPKPPPYTSEVDQNPTTNQPHSIMQHSIEPMNNPMSMPPFSNDIRNAGEGPASQRAQGSHRTGGGHGHGPIGSLAVHQTLPANNLSDLPNSINSNMNNIHNNQTNIYIPLSSGTNLDYTNTLKNEPLNEKIVDSCQFAQELIQKIVQKTVELMMLYNKNSTLPNGTSKSKDYFKDKMNKANKLIKFDSLTGPNQDILGMVKDLERVYEWIGEEKLRQMVERDTHEEKGTEGEANSTTEDTGLSNKNKKSDPSKMAAAIDIKVDDLLSKLNIIDPLPGKTDDADKNTTNDDPEMTDQTNNSAAESSETDCNAEKTNIDQAQIDRIKYLRNERDNLKSQLDERDVVLDEVVQQLRLMGLEINALSWSLK